MDKLNILVLHSLGNPDSAPFFLKQHVFSLKTDQPEHNYIYHDTLFSLPNYVRDISFDAIILDVTFLCARWSPSEAFRQLRESYSFVKDCNAVKIAFPQDEYDCNEVLDDWMCDWNVDVVYSVISSNWEFLYPNYHKQGLIKLGYTGYINETLINMERRPFEQRSIDIGYRARKLLPYFGCIGEVKWTIGRDVEIACINKSMELDIKLGEAGYLSGNQWLDFINNTKFTLGSNSGSSLLDPRGQIQYKVKKYLADYPDAKFKEVEESCFKGLDRHYSFTAISPRVMEAALLDSCQILVEGEYSGIIKPWEHYIPIKDDASDFDDVYMAMHDKTLVKQLVMNCRTAILECEDLRCGNRSVKVIDIIDEFISRKNISSTADEVARISSRYEYDMSKIHIAYWRRQKYRQKLIKFIDEYPTVSRMVRKARDFVKKHV